MAQNKQKNPPDLTAVLQNLKTDIFNTMNCVNVGIIQSFDSDDQTVSVEIALKRVKSISDDGTRVIEERPVLLKCPVVILFGGSTYITFPIAAGDECLVLFNDREIDNWWTNGGVNTPTTARAHDISDGFALVGVRSLQKSIENYLTTGIRLSHITARMDMTQDQIDTIASNFIHDGNMRITENLTVQGNTNLQGRVFGDGSGTLDLDADLIQQSGREIRAGNGASGTFDVVTVVDGIVTGGS